MASLPFHCLHLPDQARYAHTIFSVHGSSQPSVSPPQLLPPSWQCALPYCPATTPVLPTSSLTGPLLPATAASCPPGAEPRQGWHQSSSLVGLAGTLSPGWMLFPAPPNIQNTTCWSYFYNFFVLLLFLLKAFTFSIMFCQNAKGQVSSFVPILLRY